MRGGNDLWHRLWDYGEGPSPRARGKRWCQVAWTRAAGSIPACAGETYRLRSSRFPQWVHPRVRGGNTDRYRVFLQDNGPSPRARGKLANSRGRLASLRSIPACAGETANGRLSENVHGVHPRVRGGNSGSPTKIMSPMGPSPRARGKLLWKVRPSANVGSIPACAGETSRLCYLARQHGVHPRVRGGNSCGQTMQISPSGPSPRARGKLHIALRSSISMGSIPACAGETVCLRV